MKSSYHWVWETVLNICCVNKWPPQPSSIPGRLQKFVYKQSKIQKCPPNPVMAGFHPHIDFHFILVCFPMSRILLYQGLLYPTQNLLVTRNHHYIYMHRKLCCLAVHHTYLGTYQATHYLESTLAHIKARWPHMK